LNALFWMSTIYPLPSSEAGAETRVRAGSLQISCN
jgi:hypothetical protein